MGSKYIRSYLKSKNDDSAIDSPSSFPNYI